MRVTMLHPFTPAAAGVKENSVQLYHSQPHRKSMEMLADIPGYDCSIQYFTPRIFPYSLRRNDVTTEFFPVTWTWNGDHKKWKKQTSKSCYRRYSKNCPDVSIINMSAHASPFSFQLSKLIRQNGKPYIAMLGGQHYSDETWIREYYHNAHHLLVHTYLQKKVMEQMDMFKGLDIRVFPLGVDCDYFKPAEDRSVNQKEISLLFIGRIIEWKRTHLAIEVVKKMMTLNATPVKLKIVGPVASDSYFIKLQNLVKDYNLEDHVMFMGYQDHDNVRNILLETDLLLLPSDKETFGMVIIESMACGVPVAGVKGGHGPDEVIVDGVNGVLTTADQYVEAVSQFLEQDANKMSRIRQAARETALSNFSIEQTFRVLQKTVLDCST